MPSYWDELRRRQEDVDLSVAESMEGKPRGQMGDALAALNILTYLPQRYVSAPIKAGVSRFSPEGDYTVAGPEGTGVPPQDIPKEQWVEGTSALAELLAYPALAKGYSNLRSSPHLQNQAGRWLVDPSIKEEAARAIRALPRELRGPVSKGKTVKGVVRKGLREELQSKVQPLKEAYGRFKPASKEAIVSTKPSMVTNPQQTAEHEIAHLIFEKMPPDMKERIAGRIYRQHPGIFKDVERLGYQGTQKISEAIPFATESRAKELVQYRRDLSKAMKAIRKKVARGEQLTPWEDEAYAAFQVRGGAFVSHPEAMLEAELEGMRVPRGRGDEPLSFEKAGRMTPEEIEALRARVAAEKANRPVRTAGKRDEATEFLRSRGESKESYIDKGGVKRREPGLTRKKGKESLDIILKDEPPSFEKAGDLWDDIEEDFASQWLRENDPEELAKVKGIKEGPDRELTIKRSPGKQSQIEKMREKEVAGEKAPLFKTGNIPPEMKKKLPKKYGPAKIAKTTSTGKAKGKAGGGKEITERKVADVTLRRWRQKIRAASGGSLEREGVRRFVTEKLKHQFTPEEIEAFVERVISPGT